MRGSREEPRVKATWNHWLEYALLRGVVAVLSPFGIRRASNIGARIGALGYWPLGIRRRVVTRHLAACFPGLDAREGATLARETYEHLGRVAMESALLSRLGPESLLGLFERVEGWDAIERGRARGKGLVLVAGHLGNWELSGACLSAMGVPLAAVAKHQLNPLADAFVNRTRRRLGMVVVFDDEAVRKLPRLFKEGYGIGLLADQAGLGAATHVPFFGRPARTPRGPAVFALRFGAPLIYALAARQPNGRFVLHLEEVEVQSTGNLEADVDATVTRFTAVLEKWVRRYPGQYLWAHRRWKRQPPDTPPELREP
ncbi:MAG: lysophospholipid acyltransferase family protein [Gemmatimonadota bacterium]